MQPSPSRPRHTQERGGSSQSGHVPPEGELPTGGDQAFLPETGCSSAGGLLHGRTWEKAPARHLPALWPWESYPECPSLSFFTCQWELRTLRSFGGRKQQRKELAQSCPGRWKWSSLMLLFPSCKRLSSLLLFAANQRRREGLASGCRAPLGLPSPPRNHSSS